MRWTWSSILLSVACGKVLVPTDDAGIGSNEVRVEISLVGDGEGIVTSAGGEISCGTTCVAELNRGAIIELRAQAAGTSSFAGWGGECAGSSETCLLTVSADVSIEARFERTARTLTISLAGNGTGSVTADLGELACPGDCDETYPTGSQVRLIPAANTGSTFAGWSVASCPGNGECSVRIETSLSITATFNVQQHELSVQKLGPGNGSVVSIPPGIDCGDRCSADFAEGTIVNLSITAAAGSRFVGWSGACEGAACDITIDSPASAAASFERVPLIATGGAHSCALLPSGDLQCWGYNASGQLGRGDKTNVGAMELASSVPPVALPRNIRQLCAGGLHTCALFDGGQVRCWGLNFDGQLGLNHNEDVGDDASDLPIQTNVQIGASAKQIACGGGHNCALLDDGRVRCWGRGADGQLGYNCAANIGDGTFDCNGLSLSDDVPLGGVAIQIAAGHAHTCAVLDTGRLRCWGNNQNGGLGYGHTDNVGDDPGEMPVVDVPLPGTVTRVALGDYHTCALVGTNDIYCWGQNQNGELGRGNLDEIWTPPPDPLDLGASIAQLKSGSTHVCAVTSARTLRCFGRGFYGQLGNGTTANIGDDPADIITDLALTNVVDLSLGAQHTCAITSNDRVFCWGRGQEGQLGGASMENVLTAGSNQPVF
jgi:alpha-tubulin suppressor-like RCC1 family protein